MFPPLRLVLVWCFFEPLQQCSGEVPIVACILLSVVLKKGKRCAQRVSGVSEYLRFVFVYDSPYPSLLYPTYTPSTSGTSSTSASCSRIGPEIKIRNKLGQSFLVMPEPHKTKIVHLKRKRKKEDENGWMKRETYSLQCVHNSVKAPRSTCAVEQRRACFLQWRTPFFFFFFSVFLLFISSRQTKERKIIKN